LGQTSTFIQREKRLREERQVDIVAVLADRGRGLSSGVSSNESKKEFIFFPQTCSEVDIVSLLADWGRGPTSVLVRIA
jgi:hypothetical protein